jgi:hypothetical protein
MLSLCSGLRVVLCLTLGTLNYALLKLLGFNLLDVAVHSPEGSAEKPPHGKTGPRFQRQQPPWRRPSIPLALVMLGASDPPATPCTYRWPLLEGPSPCPTKPAYSPELNPIEWVWAHVKRSLTNLVEVALDRLEALVRNRLKRLQYRPETLDGFAAGTGLALDEPASP